MNINSTADKAHFSARILTWFAQHGRHDLPWQQQPNAYKVWLSEIMLQQTQVITVIDYYHRFLDSFPTLQSLAEASTDEVLALWSGLGYYARARNLHKTAKIICDDFEGQFPTSIEAMQTLPGIGRSTAAAILSFAMQQSHAILDGNVKRVLARHYEVGGWTGTSSTLKTLWEISEALTPQKNTANFNQAMMDMGATVCTRSKPKCSSCCLNATCLAYKKDSWAQYPNAKPKKKKPLKQAYLAMLINDKAAYLEKRPPSGIWGSLWSLPEFDTEELATSWIERQAQDFKKKTLSVYTEAVLHRFSHYDFMIHLVVYRASNLSLRVNEGESAFLTTHQLQGVGLPTPIKKLLNQYFNQSSD